MASERHLDVYGTLLALNTTQEQLALMTISQVLCSAARRHDHRGYRAALMALQMC